MLEESVAEFDHVGDVDVVGWLVAGDVFFTTERCGDGVDVVADLGEFVDVGDRQQVVEVAAGFLDGLSGFADHGVGLELDAEDLAGELSELVECPDPAPERCRRGDRRCCAEWPVGLVHAECATEAAEQHGDVGALGAVVGVELVEHEVLQRVGLVGGPQVAVLAPEQEEVEHLVVGEQDVGRVVAQHFALVDEVVLAPSVCGDPISPT